VVDRILGGKGVALPKPRELTEIENRIVHRVMLMILDSLRRSWEQLIEFKLTVVHQESDPLIVQIVAGSEMVILVAYEIHIGESVGAMNMCIPLMVLNPVLDQISQQTRFMRKMPQEMMDKTRLQIERVIKKTSLPVDAILGRAVLPLSELAKLQVGDIVQLDSDTRTPFNIEVGGIPKYRAVCGRRGEQSAVQVVELMADE
jgi:flagellar motor switch protein FliM